MSAQDVAQERKAANKKSAEGPDPTWKLGIPRNLGDFGQVIFDGERLYGVTPFLDKGLEGVNRALAMTDEQIRSDADLSLWDESVASSLYKTKSGKKVVKLTSYRISKTHSRALRRLARCLGKERSRLLVVRSFLKSTQSGLMKDLGETILASLGQLRQEGLDDILPPVEQIADVPQLPLLEGNALVPGAAEGTRAAVEPHGGEVALGGPE